MGSNPKFKGAWSGTQTGPRPMKALMLGCTDGAQEWGIASTLDPHHISAEMYAIKACVVENIEKSYTVRNILYSFDRKAATEAFDSFQVNSKLFWDIISPW
jgi:hypothetical protein